jgi:hypothetical protein
MEYLKAAAAAAADDDDDRRKTEQLEQNGHETPKSCTGDMEGHSKSPTLSRDKLSLLRGGQKQILILQEAGTYRTKFLRFIN